MTIIWYCFIGLTVMRHEIKRDFTAQSLKWLSVQYSTVLVSGYKYSILILYFIDVQVR